MRRDYITAKTIIKLEKERHVVFIYPRRHEVKVDGFKLYKVSAGTLNKYKYYKKTGILVA